MQRPVKDTWRTITRVLLLLAIIGAWTMAPFTVTATDMKIFRVTVTHRLAKSQALPAPDDKRHILAVGTREGEAVFDNGDIAAYTNTTIVDGWIGKEGLYKGYTRMSFKDGSEIFFSWEATGKRSKDNIPVTQGTGTITRGTGRFDGIQGSVVFRTIPSKVPAQDPGHTAVSNAVIVYTMP